MARVTEKWKDVSDNTNTQTKWNIETRLNYINKFRISDKLGELSASKLLLLDVMPRMRNVSASFR